MKFLFLTSLLFAVALCAHGGLPNIGSGCSITNAPKCVLANQLCNGTNVCDSRANAPGLFCNENSTCETRRQLGANCTNFNQCASLNCNVTCVAPATQAPTNATPIALVYQGQSCNATALCQGQTACANNVCVKFASLAEGATCYVFDQVGSALLVTGNAGNRACGAGLYCNGGTATSGTCVKATAENNIANCTTDNDCDVTNAGQVCKCVSINGTSGICFTLKIAFPTVTGTSQSKCAAFYDSYMAINATDASTATAQKAAFTCLDNCVQYLETPLVTQSLQNFVPYYGAQNTVGCVFTNPNNCPVPTATRVTESPMSTTASASTVAISFFLIFVAFLF